MRKLLWALLILQTFLSSGWAARLKTIYEAKVPVESQSREYRHQLVSEAFAQVLIKVSGNPHVLENPQLKSNLVKAKNWIQEFSYSKSEDPSKPYWLNIKFDPDAINNLLRKANAPIWGSNRPLTLMCIEDETSKGHSEIIDSSAASETHKILKQYAESRGIPILFPLMDMTDLNGISVQSIGAMDFSALKTASKRYKSDAILSAVLTGAPGNFTLQAKAINEQDEWVWNIMGKTVPDVMHVLIDNLTDTLASKYATVVTPVINDRLLFQINGISGEEEYAHLIHYLKQQTPVAAFEVVQITGESVLLNISLHGSRDAFLKMLSVGNKISLLPSADSNKLVSQWNH